MISAAVDDLAFLAVDAVIRPADEWLEPASAAAARLDQQAGSAFALQRRVNSPLDLGAAVVTGSGELAAPFVLHVVIRTADRPTDAEAVRRALTSAWHRAVEWQLTRLAAPPIGAGPGQLSLEEAVGLLAESTPPAERFSGDLTIVLEREDERAIAEAVLRGRGS